MLPGDRSEDEREDWHGGLEGGGVGSVGIAEADEEEERVHEEPAAEPTKLGEISVARRWNACLETIGDELFRRQGRGSSESLPGEAEESEGREEPRGHRRPRPSAATAGTNRAR